MGFILLYPMLTFPQIKYSLSCGLMSFVSSFQISPVSACLIHFLYSSLKLQFAGVDTQVCLRVPSLITQRSFICFCLLSSPHPGSLFFPLLGLGPCFSGMLPSRATEDRHIGSSTCRSCLPEDVLKLMFQSTEEWGRNDYLHIFFYLFELCHRVSHCSPRESCLLSDPPAKGWECRGHHGWLQSTSVALS